MSKNSTICAVPWMHLNFEPNGKVVPCCLTSVHNYFAGDLTTQPITEIWNSENMKNLRKQMINGEEPSICNKCFDRERVTGESGRVYHNREFADVLDRIPLITEEDGHCNEMNLLYWDFRFSNLCNFKCRSCGPRYSSAWVPDAKKLGTKIEYEKVTNIDEVDNADTFSFLENQILNVRKIYFAGGEPLLMPEHWKILKLLVDNKRFDVKLNYNTNASILTYEKQNVLDYWKLWEFPKLEVWPSIDEIGKRAELIRAGTNWSKVENNLIEISKLDNIIVRPGITVGAWNVHRLPEIITHLVEIGIIKTHLRFKNFFLNLIEDPKHYHIHILPDWFKAETIIKLNSFIASYKEKYNTDISELFTHVLHELTKTFSLSDATQFVNITEKLDLVRKENTYEVLPEMLYVKQEVEKNT